MNIDDIQQLKIF